MTNIAVREIMQAFKAWKASLLVTGGEALGQGARPSQLLPGRQYPPTPHSTAFQAEEAQATVSYFLKFSVCLKVFLFFSCMITKKVVSLQQNLQEDDFEADVLPFAVGPR